MESVKHYTKSRQILQQNVFRHCTDFTFPRLASFPALWCRSGGGISPYEGSYSPLLPHSSLMGREVWLVFRHLSLLLGFNTASVSGRTDGQLRRGGGQNKHIVKYNMLVDKGIRCTEAWGDCFCVLGSVDLTNSIFLGIFYIDVRTGSLTHPVKL